MPTGEWYTIPMSSQENLIPGPIAPFWQGFDRVTMPALHRLNILNDTRAWHIQSINPDLVDLDLASVTSTAANPDNVPLYDQDRSLIHAAAAHTPQLPGGRREYSVFKIARDVREFDLFTGYVSRRLSDSGVIKAELIKYPAPGPYFRMLNATPGTYTIHFAVNNAGEQLPIEFVESGRLGKKHDRRPEVPLR